MPDPSKFGQIPGHRVVEVTPGESWEVPPIVHEEKEDVILHEIMTYDKINDRRKGCHARLTVVEHIYYQGVDCNGKDHSVSLNFSQDVVSDEQPYVRELKVTADWRQLDRGWIKGCGMMVLENPKTALALIQLAVIPTSEWVPVTELLKTMEPAFTLRPGRSLRAEPEEIDRLFVRCPSGETKVNLTLYPE